MNCQQICKISRKKTTKVKIFWKVLGGYFFWNTLYMSDCGFLSQGNGIHWRSSYLWYCWVYENASRRQLHQSLVDLDMASSHDRVLKRWIVSSLCVMMKWYLQLLIPNLKENCFSLQIFCYFSCSTLFFLKFYFKLLYFIIFCCYLILASVCSPVIRCLSRGDISKTTQDRPIVTMEHYIEVGTADSVATFNF